MKTARSRLANVRAEAIWPWSLAALVALAFGLGLVTAAPGQGDVDRGAALFSRSCAVCHSVMTGLHMEGPSLAGVYGRQAGSVPFFTNYRALRGLDVVWDEEALNAWLADPRGFTGRGSAMSVKVADARDRADVIAYLKTLN